VSLTLTETTGYLVGTVFRLWANYWLEDLPATPPLLKVREGGDRDVFFASTLPAEEVLGFLSSRTDDRDYVFAPSSDWVLDASRYLGEWSVFGVKRRG
jgi:hypothetical protein